MGSSEGMEEKSRERRRHFSAEERALVVGLYKESGLSQAEFCRREGIAANNLQRWLARKAGGSSASQAGVRLVEVQRERQTLEYGGAYRIGAGNGMWVEFGNGFDAGEVRILAAILREGAGC